VVSGLTDEIPWCRKNRVKFMGIICIVQFVLALPMVMQSGMYWVTLVDWYASGLPLMIAAACEIICISWVYGVDRFLYDLECMVGYRPGSAPWWKLAWTLITPGCIVLLIVCYFIFYSPVTYNGMRYPGWAEVVGWLSLLMSVACIPITAVYQIKNHPRAVGLATVGERVRELMKPEASWGPKDPNVHYKYRDGDKEDEMVPVGRSSSGKEDWGRADDSIASDSSPPPAYEAGK